MASKPTISKQLLSAIDACPETLYAIAIGAGVDTAALYRFIDGERDIYLETAAKLADYLDLELVRRKPARD